MVKFELLSAKYLGQMVCSMHCDLALPSNLALPIATSSSLVPITLTLPVTVALWDKS